MGLFGKKKEAKEQKPIEEVMAQNVFGKTLLPGEKIDYCIQGKGQAEKLVFSTAVLAVTEKRCLYFEQDGSQSKTETLMELQQDIVFDQAEDRIGEELLVMIEGKVADENAYVGRTYRDAPNVDGLIFVNTSEELMSGDFARVKVTGSADYDLIGELL